MVSNEGACAAYYLYRRMNERTAGARAAQSARLKEMNPVG
jgi:hypothetical protein